MGNGKEGEAWEGREKLPLWVKGFQVIMIALCVCVYNFLGGSPSLVLILQRDARKGLECG